VISGQAPVCRKRSSALFEEDLRSKLDTPHRIRCHLDDELALKGMTLTELSERTGITMANLSIIKTNKARAIRFTTLTAICVALDTTPAELFSPEDMD
jgi:putative transcriptional regulator